MAQTDTATQRGAIENLFAEVVTYQVGVADAVFTPHPDGRYDVRLTLEAQQFQASGLGQQQAMPLNLPVTIELADEDNQPIEMVRPVLSEAQATIALVTDEQPTFAAVDPEYKLPSAYLQDNVKRLQLDEEEGAEVSNFDEAYTDQSR
ncbi:MAG: hypothetical protein AAF329_16820 [Cyanobacteria bacterium P01_A01_bin.17]